MLAGGCPWQVVHELVARQEPAVSVCVWQELQLDSATRSAPVCLPLVMNVDSGVSACGGVPAVSPVWQTPLSQTPALFTPVMSACLRALASPT